MSSLYPITLLSLCFSFARLCLADAPDFGSQKFLGPATVGGHNELFRPSPNHPVPGKVPLTPDESVHYFSKYVNGSENGYYRRSSCPAVNTLANRGYINRSGRNITYEEIAQAARDVYNFGDDNVSIFNHHHEGRPI